MPGDDDLCLIEARKIGNTDKLLGISACNARGSYMFHSSGATGGYHSPLGSCHFGQALANPVGQFIVLHKVSGCCLHGGTDLRSLQRSSNYSKRAPAIDDRLNADGLENIRFGGFRIRYKLLTVCVRKGRGQD